MKKTPISGYIFALVMLLICSMVLTSFIREYGKGYFLAKYAETPSENTLKKNAEKWLEAVKAENWKKAVVTAKILVPSADEPELPEFPFLKIIRAIGVNSSFLTDNFNKNDFLYWRDCFDMMQTAERLKAEKKATPKGMFEFINTRSTSDKSSNGEIVFCSELLKKKELSEPEKLRTLCALAKQAGYETKILAVRKNNEKTFFLCELKKGDETTTVDFLNGTLYDKSFQELLKSTPANLMEKFKKAEIVYIQPSELFDFRLANQKLAEILAESGLKNVPVFGENPDKLLNGYKQKHLLEKNKSYEIDFTYWDVPLIPVKKLLLVR